MRLCTVIFLVLLLTIACRKDEALSQSQKAVVRKPVVAGQFYPARAGELRQEIEGMLDRAPAVSAGGKIIALSVPHAGYAYSGPTAAAAYKQVAGQAIELVVVLAPSHRDYVRGGSLFQGDAYETPLGKMMVDKALARKLTQSCEHFQFSSLGHGMEHSLEVQLPFIQTLFPQAKLLPIIIGSFDWPGCHKMGMALAKVLQDKKALLVASTDLYHGYSYETCKRSDEATLKAMLALQPQALCEGFLRESLQACGAGPVVIVQVAARELGADKATLISRTNSNDVTGEKGGYVVGYGSIAYSNSDGSGRKTFQPLEKNVQKELLRMARKSIEHYLKTRTRLSFQPTHEVMKEKRGVFVTITEGGMLRGCIGYHESDRPLYELVPDRAIAAAFEDPRFPPLRPDELDKILIKISVYLTNVYRINDIGEFEMGKHGIIIVKGGRGATYLPEVPQEAGWRTVEEEMESLCQKAGLPSGAWRDGAEFYVYRTQVFDEKMLND
ncbi:AmmeMemoRadiSam system protein B [candidate division KSB1 bacterium]|nr:AmmeMemoRadiSam system protein B [candidate division KSB1 bacterium]